MQNLLRKTKRLKSSVAGFINKTAHFDFRVIVTKPLKMNKTPCFQLPVTKKCFTLIEILIVIAVIGILFVTLVPRIDFAGDKARETGVKTDFRAFSLAAEQLLRENAGIAKHDTLEKACAANGGLNLYLDPALQFSTAGTSNGSDPWNSNYTVQVAKPASGNANNGCIIFLSNGKDSSLTNADDNYAIATVFIDGRIETETIGFSSNIEADSIDSIESSATDADMTISSGVVTVKYTK